MVNIELLKATLVHIEAHPGEWNQDMWRCGSAACFAGHAAVLAGASWITDPDGNFLDDQPLTVEEAGWSLQNQGVAAGDRAITVTGPDVADVPANYGWFTCEGVAHVADYARTTLGLTRTQAGALFDGANELVDLERMVGALAEDPDSDLAFARGERNDRIRRRLEIEDSSDLSDDVDGGGI